MESLPLEEILILEETLSLEGLLIGSTLMSLLTVRIFYSLESPTAPYYSTLPDRLLQQLDQAELCGVINCVINCEEMQNQCLMNKGTSSILARGIARDRLNL